jgi:diadenylate cyclase
MFDNFGIINVIDIAVLGLLLYIMFLLLKGTTAFTVSVGLYILLAIYGIARFFKMPMMSEILGAFWKIGLILVVVVFKQEIRRFLMLLGKNVLSGNKFSVARIFPMAMTHKEKELHMMEAILEACYKMSEERTGALIVFTGTTELKYISQSGTNTDAVVSSRLIETIFNKSSPLHDGALIISRNRIRAAGCILPISQEITNLPENVGTRHRAAVSITAQSDASAIIVSEENGSISITKQGLLFYNLSKQQLLKELLEQQENG